MKVQKKSFRWTSLARVIVIIFSLEGMDQNDQRQKLIDAWRLNNYRILTIPSLGLTGVCLDDDGIAFDSSGNYLIQKYKNTYQVINVRNGECSRCNEINGYTLDKMVYGDAQKCTKTLSSQLPDKMYYRCWFIPGVQNILAASVYSSHFGSYQDCYSIAFGLLAGRCGAIVSKNGVCESQDIITLFDTEQALPFAFVPMENALVGNNKSIVINEKGDIIAALLTDHTIALISPYKPLVVKQRGCDVFMRYV